MLCPLGFRAELRGLRHLVLYWMYCVFLERIIKGDAVALFLQPQGSVVLLYSSWSSPWLQPTAHKVRWEHGLVRVLCT